MNKTEFYEELNKGNKRLTLLNPENGTKYVINAAAKANIEENTFAITDGFKRTLPDDICSVWDIDNKLWKSFFLSNVLKIEPKA